MDFQCNGCDIAINDAICGNCNFNNLTQGFSCYSCGEYRSRNYNSLCLNCVKSLIEKNKIRSIKKTKKKLKKYD